MNHIFRVIFDKTKGVWIAVSELTKSHGKEKASQLERGNIQKQQGVRDVLFKLNGASALIFIGGLLASSIAQADIAVIGSKITNWDQRSAPGENSVALNLNDNNVIGGGSVGTGTVAIGHKAWAAPENAVVIGRDAWANTNESVTIGYNSGSDNTGQSQTVVGSRSRGKGQQSVVVGNFSAASAQSVALGSNVFARGEGSIAIGNDDLIGSSRWDTSAYQDQLPTETIKSIYRDLWSDNWYFNSETQFSGSYINTVDGKPYKIFSPTYAAKRGGIAIGSRTVAGGEVSTALGSLSFALADKSTAVGIRAYVAPDATGGSAIGENSRVFAPNSVAIGNITEASNLGTVAYGYRAYAVGNSSMALGVNVVAGAPVNSGLDIINAYAPGNDGNIRTLSAVKQAVDAYFTAQNANGGRVTRDTGNEYLNIGGRSIRKSDSAGAENSIVLGNSSIALKSNTVAIGYGTLVDAQNSMGIGSYNYIDSSGNDSIIVGLNNRQRGSDRNTIVGLNNIIRDGGTSDSIIVGSDVYLGNASARSALLGSNIRIQDNSFNTSVIGSGATVGYNLTRTVDRNGFVTYTAGNSGNGADNALVLGTNAKIGSSSKNSFAMGYAATVANNASNSFAIGREAEIQNSAANSAAIGIRATVLSSANAGLALGNGSEVTMSNSVSLGVNSKTDYGFDNLNKPGWVAKGAISIPTSGKTGVISVGAIGQERRIVNVASGALDTDAVNVAQLRTIDEKFELQIDELQNGGGIQFLAVDRTNTNGEAGTLNANLKKSENYQQYVKLKTQALYFAARKKLNDEAFNQTSLDKLNERIDQLGALYNNQVKGTASALNAAQIRLDSINASALNDRDKAAKFNEILAAIAEAETSDAGKTMPGAFTQAQADAAKQGNNYLNDGAQGADSIAIGWKANTAETTASAVGGKHAIALGYSASASAEKATAIGDSAVASGLRSIAIGTGAKATGEQSISVGVGNTVSGKNSGAFGDPNNITGESSYAIGNNNTISTNNTFVLGNNVSSTLNNSVFLGEGAAYIDDAVSARNSNYNAVTLGGNTYNGFAGAAPVGVLSIGNKTGVRRIQGVAAGLISSTSTDAINGSQLYSILDKGTLIKGDFSNSQVNNTVAMGMYYRFNTASWQGNGVQYQGENLATYVKLNATGQNELSIGLRDDPTFKSLKLSTTGLKAGDGVTLTSTADTVTFKSQANATAKLTNLTNADITATSTDAVTGQQLFGLQNKTISLSGDTGTTTAKKINDNPTFGIKTGDNYLSSKAENNDVTISLKTDALVTKLGESFTKVDGTNVPTKTGNPAAYNQWRTALGIGDGVNWFNVNAQKPDAANLANSNFDKEHSGAIGNNAVAVGSFAKADGVESIAIGHEAGKASALGNQAIAIGSKSEASGAGGVSLGYGSKATGSASTALGAGAVATGRTSIAIGRAQATQANSVALGNGAKAEAVDTFVIGSSSEVKATESGAFGKSNTLGTAALRSYAVGNSNTINANDSFVLGNNVNADKQSSVYLGDRTGFVTAAASKGTDTGYNEQKVGDITYKTFAGDSPVGIATIGSDTQTRRLQGVASGWIDAKSTDAINGSQLYATNSVLSTAAKSVKDKFGGTAALNETTGEITYTNIGGTGKNTIDEALKASREKVVAAQNGGLVVTDSDQATGAKQFEVKIDDTLKAKIDNLPDNTQTELDKKATKDLDNLTETGKDNVAALVEGAVKAGSATYLSVDNKARTATAPKKIEVGLTESAINKLNAIDVDAGVAKANQTVKLGADTNETTAQTLGQAAGIKFDITGDTADGSIETEASGSTVKVRVKRSGITTDHIKDGTITNADIAEGTINESKLDAATKAKLDDAATDSATLKANTLKLAGNTGNTDGQRLDKEGGLSFDVKGDGTDITSTAAGSAVTFSLNKATALTNAGAGQPDVNKVVTAGAVKSAIDDLVTKGFKVKGDTGAEQTIALDSTLNVNGTNDFISTSTDEAGKVKIDLAQAVKTKLAKISDTGGTTADAGQTIKLTDGNGASTNEQTLGQAGGINFTVKNDDASIVTTADGDAIKVKVADKGITTAKLADDAVTQDKIADNAVGTDQIADGAVTEAKLDDATKTKLNTASTDAAALKANTFKLKGDTNSETTAQSLGQAGGLAFTIKGSDDITTKASASEVALTLNKATEVTEGNTKAVTSGAVYTALDNLKTAGIKFEGDKGGEQTLALGNKVKITGADNYLETTSSADGVDIAFSDSVKTKLDGLSADGKLAYKANGGAAKKTSLAEGLNFTNGTNTTAVVEDNGVVKYNLNDALTGINSIAGNGTTATFGADGLALNNKKITGLAKGTAGTDAVNVSQLKTLADTLGASLGGDGTVTGPTYANPVSGSGNANAPTSTKDAVDNLITAVNKGLVFAADSGANVTRHLGDTLTINGQENYIVTKTDGNAVKIELSADAKQKLDNVGGKTADGAKKIRLTGDSGQTSDQTLGQAEDIVFNVIKGDDSIVTEAVAGSANVKVKVANGGITSEKIADGAVTEVKVADDAITSAKIKDGEIKTADIADGAVDSSKIKDGSITNDDISDETIDGFTKIKDGTIGTNELADGSVTNSKIADDAVTSDKIKNGSVQGEDLKDGTITEDKLANTVQDKINKTNEAADKVFNNTLKLTGDGGSSTTTQKLSQDGGLSFAIVGNDDITTKAENNQVSLTLNKTATLANATVGGADENKVVTAGAVKSALDTLTTNGIKFAGDTGGEQTLALGAKLDVNGNTDFITTKSSANKLEIDFSDTVKKKLANIDPDGGATAKASQTIVLKDDANTATTSQTLAQEGGIEFAIKGQAGYIETKTEGKAINVSLADAIKNKLDGLSDDGKLAVKANGAGTAKVSLTDGVNFIDGQNTTAKVNDNGDVTFNVNDKLTNITSITNGATSDAAGATKLDISDTGLTLNDKQIKGVKKGTADADAVNVSQLKTLADTLGASVGDDGTVTGPTYNNAVKGSGKEAAPTSTKGAVDDLITAVNKGLKFGADLNDATTKQLGEQLDIKAGDIADNGTNYKGKNLKTEVSGGNILIGLKETPEFTSLDLSPNDGTNKVSLTPDENGNLTLSKSPEAGNPADDKVVIKGIKDGTTDDSAVTKGTFDELKSQIIGATGGDGTSGTNGLPGKDGINNLPLADKVNALRDGVAGNTVYTKADGTRVVFDHTDGKYYELDPATGKKKAGAAEIPASDVIVSVVDPNGETTKPVTLGNLASALGVDTKANPFTAATAADAQTKVNALLTQTDPTQLNRAATAADLQVLAQAGIDFLGNQAEANKIHKTLGSTLKIEGKSGVNYDADGVAAKYSADNLITHKNGDALRIEFLKAPTFEALTLKPEGSDTGVKLSPTVEKGNAKLTLSKDPTANGEDSAVVLDGIKDGDGPNSAVTKGAVDKLVERIGAGKDGINGIDGREGLDGTSGKDYGVPNQGGNKGPAANDGLSGTTLANKVQGLRDGIAGTVVYTDEAGNRVLAENGKYYDASLVDGLQQKASNGLWYPKDSLNEDGSLKEGVDAKSGKTLAQLADGNADKVLANDKVMLSTVNPDGSTKEPVRLANLANALGDSLPTVDADTDADGLQAKARVAKAQEKVTNLLAGTNPANLSRVATAADLQVLAEAGIDFLGNQTDNAEKRIHKTLGSVLNIEGKSGVDYDTAGVADKYSADNLITHNDGGKLRIEFLKAPTFEELNLIKNGKGLTLAPTTDKGGNTVLSLSKSPKDEGDNADNRVILDGIKDGTGPNSAVTKGAIDKLVERIGAGKDGINGVDGYGKDGYIGKDGYNGQDYGIPNDGTNGLNGPAGRDGLNGTTLANKVQGLRDGIAGTVVYTKENGERVLVENGKYYDVELVKGRVQKASDGLWYPEGSLNADGSVKEGTDKDAGKTLAELAEANPNKELELGNDKVMLSAVNPDGTTKAPVTIANLTSALGGAPVATPASEEGTIPAKTKVEDAQAKVANLLGGTNPANLSRVATAADLQVLAEAGLDFAGNKGDTVHRQLGTKLAIVGKLNEGKTAGAEIADESLYSSNNLATFTDSTNNLVRIAMLAAPEFKAVNLKDGENGVTLKPTENGLQLSKYPASTEKGADNRVEITGVKDGTSPDSVVTKGAVDKLVERIGAGNTAINGVDGREGIDGKNGTNGDYGVPKNGTDGLNGPAGRDGLNGTTLANKVQGLRDGIAGTVVYTDAAGNRVLAENGKYYNAEIVNGKRKANNGLWYDADKVADDGSLVDGVAANTGKTLVQLNTDNGDDKELAADKVMLSAVNPNGGTANQPVTIANLANSLGENLATVDAATDANGGQAKARTTDAQNRVAKLLAGQDKEGNPLNLSRVATAADLQVLAEAGIDFLGNQTDENKIHKTLGSTLKIEGKSGVNYGDAGYEANKYSADNLITHNDNGTLRIELLKAPTFEALTLDNGKADGENAKVTLTPTVTKDADGQATGTELNLSNGKEGEDNKVAITGVKDGTTPDSVVTKGAVDKLVERIGAGDTPINGVDGANGKDGAPAKDYGVPNTTNGLTGPAGRDGANGTTLANKVQGLRDGVSGPVVYTDAEGNRVLAENGKYYDVSLVKDDTAGVDKRKANNGLWYDKDNVNDDGSLKDPKDTTGQTLAQLATGDNTDKVIPAENVMLSAVNPDGATTTPVTIANLANSLGDNLATVSTGDDVTAEEKAAQAKARVTDAQTRVEKLLAGQDKEGNPLNLSRVATAADLQVLAEAGLDFTGNKGNTVHRPLGTKLAIVGKLNDAGNAGLEVADADMGKYSSSNIATFTDPANNLVRIAMLAAPTFEAVTLDNGKAGDENAKVTLTPTVTKDADGQATTELNLSNGKNGDAGKVAITGVKDGTTPDSVVTKGAVDKLVERIGAGDTPINGVDGANGKDGSSVVKDYGVPNDGSNGLTGPAGRDGLNGTTLANKVQGLRDGIAGTVVYTDAEGNRVLAENGKYYDTDLVDGKRKANDGLWYEADKVNDDGSLKEPEDTTGQTLAQLATGDNADKVIPAENVMLSAVNPDGATTTPVTIANLTSALGGAPKATEAGDNGDNVEAKSAVKDAQDKVATLLGKKADDAFLTRAATAADLQVLAQAGIDFLGNQADENKIHKTLGSTLKIEGKKGAIYGNKGYEANKYSADNLITRNEDGTLRIEFLKAPTFEALTLDDGTEGDGKAKVTLTPTVTKDENGVVTGTTLNLSNGKNGDDGKVVLSGIKDGDTPDSAITKGTIDKLVERIGAGDKPINGIDGANGKDGKPAKDYGVPNTTNGLTGPAGRDGANGTTLANKVQGLRDGVSGPVVYTDKDGNRLLAENGAYYTTDLVIGKRKANDGLWYAVADVNDDGSVKEPAEGQAAPTGNSLKELAALPDNADKKVVVAASNVRLSAVNASGETTKPTVLDNVADGKVAKASKEAANAGQLYSLAKAAGVIDDNGNIVTPELTKIKNADGTDGDKPTSVADGVNKLASAVNSGLTFSDGTNDGEGKQQLGSKVTIVGNNKLTDGEVSTDNVKVTYTNEGGNGTFKVALKKDAVFDTVTAGDPNGDHVVLNGNSITGKAVDPATNKSATTSKIELGKGKVTLSGSDGKKTVVLSGIADAVEANDAVNKGQLDALREDTLASLAIAGDSGEFTLGARDPKFNVKGEGAFDGTKSAADNIHVNAEMDKNGKTGTLTVKLSQDLKNLSSAEFKSANGKEGVKIDAEGIKFMEEKDGEVVDKGPIVTKDGINSQGTEIKNVGSALDPNNKDTLDALAEAANSDKKGNAVNVTDLNNTANALTNKGFKVQTNKGEAKTVKLGETVKVVDGANTKVSEITTGTDGVFSYSINVNGLPMTYVNSDNKPIAKLGEKFYLLKGNGEVNLEAGEQKVAGMALVQADAPKDSVGNAQTLSNVADGQKDTDAVNVRQLKAARSEVVSDSKNLTVNKEQNKQDGSSVFRVGMKPDIEVDTLTLGKGAKSTLSVVEQEVPEGATSKALTLGVEDIRITNVADGVFDNDAVNVKQLRTAVAEIDYKVTALDNKINTVNRDLRAGVASALAAASLPQATEAGNSMVAVAGGTYGGETAVSLGVSKISDNGKLVIKVTGTSSSRGKVGAGAGVGYQWK